MWNPFKEKVCKCQGYTVVDQRSYRGGHESINGGHGVLATTDTGAFVALSFTVREAVEVAFTTPYCCLCGGKKEH